MVAVAVVAVIAVTFCLLALSVGTNIPVLGSQLPPRAQRTENMPAIGGIGHRASAPALTFD